MSFKYFFDRFIAEFKNFKTGEIAQPFKPFRDFGEDMMTSEGILKLLCSAVARMPSDEVYVDYGVYRGGTLVPVASENPSKRCIGVDCWGEFNDEKKNRDIVERYIKAAGCKNIELKTMDFRAFFARYDGPKIGVYFVDGDHSYNATVEALEIAKPHLSDDAVIIVDDTDREDDVWAAVQTFKLSFKHSFFHRIYGTKDVKDRHMRDAWWEGITIIAK